MEAQSSTWDHPRSRGEYSCIVSIACKRLGSSPLSRGIPCSGVRTGLGGRIIPALAGNTHGPCRMRPGCPDHPRSRGEYRQVGYEPTLPGGSSPLSRGIRLVMGESSRNYGIIPALAGNTARKGLTEYLRGDHPRSRGEYYITYAPPPYRSGSSPLSRGIHQIVCDRA